MNEEKDKIEEKEVDNRSKMEKVGDAVEDFFDAAEEIVYHPKNGINEDIPASMEGPEHRKFLKYQTRRNLHRKVFAHKWVYITFGIIFGIGLLVFIITEVVAKVL